MLCSVKAYNSHSGHGWVLFPLLFFQPHDRIWCPCSVTLNLKKKKINIRCENDLCFLLTELVLGQYRAPVSPHGLLCREWRLKNYPTMNKYSFEVATDEIYLEPQWSRTICFTKSAALCNLTRTGPLSVWIRWGLWHWSEALIESIMPLHGGQMLLFTPHRHVAFLPLPLESRKAHGHIRMWIMWLVLKTYISRWVNIEGIFKMKDDSTVHLS